MSMLFAEILKRIRAEKGFSQKELAEQLYVTRSTVTRWENGSRMPDPEMILRLAKYLNADVDELLSAASRSDQNPNVIMVDDRKIILSGGLSVLEEVLPNANIAGFTRPSEAIDYARSNCVALAFLDIEMGKTSGLDLCDALLEIYPYTNVVFLTAYSDYAIDAWKTRASGFMLKPITPEGVQTQLQNLRHPFSFGGTDI